MPITVPIAGQDTHNRAPKSAVIRAALDARVGFRYQKLEAFVVSPKDLYFGIFQTDAGNAPAGTPQCDLNGMRMFLSTAYSDMHFVSYDTYAPFSESQSIDPNTFVKTPSSIEGRTVRSHPEGISEDPEPNTIKELIHGRIEHPPTPEYFDETRGSEFIYSPTFVSGLAFLNALDYATQWTASPAALHNSYIFARAGSGVGTSGNIVPTIITGSLLPSSPITQDLDGNPLLGTESINIGNYIIFGQGQTGAQFTMNRIQIRFLTKDIPYFFCQRIGSFYRYLPTTQAMTAVGQIVEIPQPDFTDIPKLVAGNSLAAYEFATLLIAGKNFHTFVQSVNGTEVTNW